MRLEQVGQAGRPPARTLGIATSAAQPRRLHHCLLLPQAVQTRAAHVHGPHAGSLGRAQTARPAPGLALPLVGSTQWPERSAAQLSFIAFRQLQPGTVPASPAQSRGPTLRTRFLQLFSTWPHSCAAAGSQSNCRRCTSDQPEHAGRPLMPSTREAEGMAAPNGPPTALQQPAGNCELHGRQHGARTVRASHHLA